MHTKGRYKKMGVFLDTCRAITFFNNMEAPNVYMMASSAEGEDSRSHVYKEDIGVYTNDVYSHYLYRYMKNLYPVEYRTATIQDLYDYLASSVKGATVKYKSTMNEPMSKVLISEFWGTPEEINKTENYNFLSETEFESLVS